MRRRKRKKLLLSLSALRVLSKAGQRTPAGAPCPAGLRCGGLLPRKNERSDSFGELWVPYNSYEVMQSAMQIMPSHAIRATRVPWRQVPKVYPRAARTILWLCAAWPSLESSSALRRFHDFGPLFFCLWMWFKGQSMLDLLHQSANVLPRFMEHAQNSQSIDSLMTHLRQEFEPQQAVPPLGA